jgi:hypothetical protein
MTSIVDAQAIEFKTARVTAHASILFQHGDGKIAAPRQAKCGTKTRRTCTQYNDANPVSRQEIVALSVCLDATAKY